MSVSPGNPFGLLRANRRWLRALICLAVLPMIAVIAVPIPTADAAWVDWSDRHPRTGSVTIPEGQVVTLDVPVDLDRLDVAGTLRCPERDMELRARVIDVSGELRCGTIFDRHEHDFTITLTGDGSRSINGAGDKYLVSRPGSRLRLFGEARTSWVRLTQTAQAGATTLQLEDNDWRVGDLIAIAPTDFDMYQAEYVRIEARNGNTVTIDRPLDYMHWCGTETYGDKSITECAEVGLLTRNITIRGDESSAASQIGGHTMYHHGSSVRLDNVEFNKMGQVGRIGRYPLHFHKFGDATGSYVQNTSIWQSYNRWATLHGVQNLKFRNNVGYDGIGHGFYFEDGDEIGNILIGNLGILAKAGEPGQLVTPSDNEAAAFWIANPDNTLINNVAAGAQHSGFWYALPERPLGGSTADLWPRQTPLKTFSGNVAHSVGFAGLMVDRGEQPNRELETTWYNPVAVPGDPDSELVTPRFNSFTSYKSRHYGMWVRTFSGAIFNRMAFADTWRSVYLANIQNAGDHDSIGWVGNSLFVGETANVGQAQTWEATGPSGRTLPKFWEPDATLIAFPFYDGPLYVGYSTFANFQPNEQRDAAALSNFFPNEFWVSPDNGVVNSQFVNSKRVSLPDVEEFVDGDATAVFVDFDGGVTGTPGASVTVAGALVDNDRCTPRPEWNAMQCDPSVGFLSATIRRLDGGSAQIDVVRDDGRSFGFDGSDDASVFLTMINDMEHRVRWQSGTPQSFDLYVPGEVKMEGRGARLVLPAPSGQWEFQVNGQYESAPNLAALNSGPSNWYFDANANEIHLRLVGDDDWITMR